MRLIYVQVQMNGLPVGRQFEQVSMYVAQEEMFVPTLSCWETLHIHAALRNRSRESAPDLQKRMQDVLSVMGLSRVRDTQVIRCVSLTRAAMRSLTAIGRRRAGHVQVSDSPCFTHLSAV